MTTNEDPNQGDVENKPETKSTRDIADGYLRYEHDVAVDELGDILDSEVDMTTVAAEVAQENVELKRELRDLIQKWRREHDRRKNSGGPEEHAWGIAHDSCADDLRCVLEGE